MGMSKLIALVMIVSFFAISFAQNRTRTKTPADLAAGYWPLEKSQPIIERTQTITLAPDMSRLSTGERTAVTKLVEVGRIFQKLYEEQRHPEAISSYQALQQFDRQTGSSPRTQNLLTLYRLSQGPIATTLENKREPFLPVDPPAPGKNVYPWNVTKEEIEQWLVTVPNND